MISNYYYYDYANMYFVYDYRIRLIRLFTKLYITFKICMFDSKTPLCFLRLCLQILEGYLTG